MGARKKRVAQKMPQEEGVNAPIMAQVKANLKEADGEPEEEKIEEPTVEEKPAEEPKPGEIREVTNEELDELAKTVVIQPKLPKYNWLKVPPGAVDMRSMKLFTPGGESYKEKYDGFIEAGYKVKSLSVNENVVYYLFER